MNRVLVASIAVLALFLAGCPQASPPGGNGQACTADAKICPDGSAVGRTGPNCEFAPCPGESGGKEMDNGGASGGSGAAGTADVQYLLAHKWNLISINGREVGENPVYIVFNGNQGTFGGSAGCNYMNGNYALDGNQISFAQTAITLMHCEEYAELESDVIGVIGGGPYAWGISGNTMSFYKGSDLVAVWEGEAG